jgi:hypothetical protein
MAASCFKREPGGLLSEGLRQSKHKRAFAGAGVVTLCVAALLLVGCAASPALLVASVVDAFTASGTGVALDADLDEAVHQAILERGGSPRLADAVAVEDHVVLACTEDAGAATVYSLVRYAEYVEEDGELVQDCGSHVPAALTFERADGAWVLSEYWEPRDGAYYAADLQERFGAGGWLCAARALDLEAFVPAQTTRCLERARAAIE